MRFSISEHWLRLKGPRNKTAGFFFELVEMTLSRTKKKDDDAGSAQIQIGPRVLTVRSVSQRTGGCFSGLPNKQTLSPLW